MVYFHIIQIYYQIHFYWIFQLRWFDKFLVLNLSNCILLTAFQLNFVKNHNLNSETSLLISEIRKIESGEEELKKNEKLIYDGFVLEVTENFIMGNLKPEDEEERLYLSTKEQQWKILNSMEIVVAIKICEIDLNKV